MIIANPYQCYELPEKEYITANGFSFSDIGARS